MTEPPASPAPPPTGTGARPRRSRAVLVLAGLAVLLVLAAAALGWRVHQQRDVERARGTALAAAQNAAVEVLSYDHRRMADDIAEAERLATGTFLEQYRSATAGLREQVEAGDVVVTARVVQASVQDAEADRVTVLLFVDQTTERVDLAEPRIEQSRIRLTMARSGDRWQVAELEAL